jgi:site-specific DNA recombinase
MRRYPRHAIRDSLGGMGNPATPTFTAAIYVRISDDRAGEGLGVKRQEEECRELAQRLGWHVVEVYADNSMSAFKKKKRPEYLRMLADIRAGKMNAIIGWAPDRFYRKMRELEDFVDLINEHKVEVATVRGGQIDLSTAIGRMIARQLGNFAAFESEIKQERIRSKINELVRDGKVHNGGVRPFGYTRIFEGEGARRKIVRDELCEAEAKLIRQARDRVFAGETLYSICLDWNSQEIVTSTGKPWTHQAMRHMLISGRIAGLKEHRRQVVGEALWPSIISREDHEELRARLIRPDPLNGRVRVRLYWLSGHVFCTCGTQMRVSQRSRSRELVYRCPPKGDGGCGGCTISYGHLEPRVRKLVIRRLKSPEFLAELAARQNTTKDEAAGLVEVIEADERRLQALRDQLSECEPEELLEVRAAIRTVRDRVNAARDKLSALAGAQPLIGVDVADLADQWERLEVSQRGALLRVAGIERVVIKPTIVRGRFDTSRVVVVPV